MRSFVLALAFLPLIQSAALPEATEEYFDVLGTGQKYRLVFRGTAHIEKSVYAAYKDGTGCPEVVEEGCKTADWNAPCQNHYRNNDALDNWKNVREVLYGLVDQGNLVKVLRFKGKNTSYLSWMQQKRLLGSCWEDLKKSESNFFSVEGHQRLHRSFFINKHYGGCPNDVGWSVVVDQANPPCNWEKKETFPYFPYATGPTAENFNSDLIGSADAVVVFVRYDYGKSKEYSDLFNKGKKEWRLAFRGTAKVGQSMFPAYQDGTGVKPDAEAACKTADWSSPCTSHWRNDDALDNWSDIDQVLVGVIHKCKMVKTIIFSGKGTTNMDWYKAENLLESCWSDLSYGPHLFFGIEGHPRIERRFFIQRHYGGCGNDVGWMVVADRESRPCGWERSDKPEEFPVIKFAAGPKAENWVNGQVLEADALVVFLKYSKP